MIMRALRPDRLLELSSGLWAVDVCQPVGAVLDPATGALRDLVSWRDLPAAPAKTDWPRPQLMGDGDDLWVQEHPAGPLVRVTRQGIGTAVWTNGLHLAACHAGVAWCQQWGRTQELVNGADAQPMVWSGMDRLLRVDAAGRSREILVDAPVRHVYATPEAAWVWLEVGPWSLHSLGADTYQVVWTRRWLRLPWDEQPPGELTAALHGQESGPAEDQPLNDPEAGRWPDPWYEPSSPATVVAAGCTWRLGWSMQVRTDRGGRWRRAVAGATTDGGATRMTDLGDGTVVAASPAGARLAVAVARAPYTPYAGRHPVDVLAVDPAGGVETLAPAESIDITALCRPVGPRPLDADSYESRILATYGELNAVWRGPSGITPLATGLSHGQARLVGSWPDTELEWTFAFATRPGLRLRRRVPLYDELGRVSEPEHASIHLMEDLDTGGVPRAEEARDGIVDV
jgi:hypothetical protein